MDTTKQAVTISMADYEEYKGLVEMKKRLNDIIVSRFKEIEKAFNVNIDVAADDFSKIATGHLIQTNMAGGRNKFYFTYDNPKP